MALVAFTIAFCALALLVETSMAWLRRRSTQKRNAALREKSLRHLPDEWPDPHAKWMY